MVEIPAFMARIILFMLHHAPQWTYRYVWPEATRLGLTVGYFQLCILWRGKRHAIAWAEYLPIGWKE